MTTINRTVRLLTIELTGELEAYLLSACSEQAHDDKLADWAKAQLVINAAEENDDDPVAMLAKFGC